MKVQIVTVLRHKPNKCFTYNDCTILYAIRHLVMTQIDTIMYYLE